MTLVSYMEIVDFLKKRVQEKDQQITEFSVAEPYKDAVSYLRAFRGIETQAAMTFIAELGDIRRFGGPKELMAYLGLVLSEHSSGNSEWRGGITKCGNSFCRHILVQAAWCYRFKPALTRPLPERQKGLPEWVTAHSFKVQKRLHKRLAHLRETRKHQVAIVAVARELAGFLGAVLVRLAEEQRWEPGRVGIST